MSDKLVADLKYTMFLMRGNKTNVIMFFLLLSLILLLLLNFQLIGEKAQWNKERPPFLK